MNVKQVSFATVSYNENGIPVSTTKTGNLNLMTDDPVMIQLAVDTAVHWQTMKKLRMEGAQIQDFLNDYSELINMYTYFGTLNEFETEAFNTEFSKINILGKLSFFISIIAARIDPSNKELPNVLESYNSKVLPMQHWNILYLYDVQNRFQAWFKDNMYSDMVTLESVRKVQSINDIWSRMAILVIEHTSKFEEQEYDEIVKGKTVTKKRKVEIVNERYYCKFRNDQPFIPVVVKPEVIELLDAEYLYKTPIEVPIQQFVKQLM